MQKTAWMPLLEASVFRTGLALSACLLPLLLWFRPQSVNVSPVWTQGWKVSVTHRVCELEVVLAEAWNPL